MGRFEPQGHQFVIARSKATKQSRAVQRALHPWIAASGYALLAMTRVVVFASDFTRAKGRRGFPAHQQKRACVRPRPPHNDELKWFRINLVIARRPQADAAIHGGCELKPSW